MKAGADKIRFVERCYELYEQKMYRVAYNILHDVNAAEDAILVKIPLALYPAGGTF